MKPVLDNLNNTVVRDGRYMPTLDGWRAVAIILVILDHGSDSYSQFFRHVGIHLDFERIRSVGLLDIFQEISERSGGKIKT